MSRGATDNPVSLPSLPLARASATRPGPHHALQSNAPDTPRRTARDRGSNWGYGHSSYSLIRTEPCLNRRRPIPEDRPAVETCGRLRIQLIPSGTGGSVACRLTRTSPVADPLIGIDADTAGQPMFSRHGTTRYRKPVAESCIPQRNDSHPTPNPTVVASLTS
jgi:hypothetical protein